MREWKQGREGRGGEEWKGVGGEGGSATPVESPAGAERSVAGAGAGEK